MKLPASVTCILRPRLPVATFHQIQRRLTCMLLHLNDWHIIANMYSLRCKISVSTLCKLQYKVVLLLKLTLILEQIQLKKKMIQAAPSPWTVNPNQALICWRRWTFQRNEVCNPLTIGSFCAVSLKSRWASLWQRNWRSVIRIRLLGLVDET